MTTQNPLRWKTGPYDQNRKTYILLRCLNVGIIDINYGEKCENVEKCYLKMDFYYYVTVKEKENLGGTTRYLCLILYCKLFQPMHELTNVSTFQKGNFTKKHDDETNILQENLNF